MGYYPEYKWINKRILVVEDDECSIFLLDDMLKQTGATIDFRYDGAEAVEYIRNHQDTDLILIDVHLPVKDGFTASREIRTLSPGVVIIAQTGYAYSIERNEAEKAGCNDLIFKPLAKNHLLATLDTFLS